MTTRNNIDKWANFLANEHLDPNSLTRADIDTVLRLCQRLSLNGGPYEGVKGSPMHKHTIEARRKVCHACFDLLIDLTKIKRRKGPKGGLKVAMGRGLLDVWNEEYTKRYGGNVGTPGVYESTRRNIVTRMSQTKKGDP